jgi:hypothetical protein
MTERLTSLDVRGSLWEHPAALEPLYAFTRQACGELTLLHDTRALFGASPLQDNPAYRECFASLPDSSGIDIAMAMPFGPMFRPLLATAVSPPCVRFRDGRVVHTRSLTWLTLRQGQSEPAEQLASAKVAADACLAVQNRWDSFQGARQQLVGSV